MAREAPRIKDPVGRVLDEYLVAAARAGDRRAFEELARRWDRKLAAHAWRLTGDRDLAAEVTQAAWLEVTRGLPRLLDERAFPAWAYRIVSRLCARSIGALQRRRTLSRALDTEAEIEPDARSEPTALDHERLRRAVRALPPGQRAALALFYFEDLSVAETAVALDVPAGTVKTRLMHARRHLRAILEGDDDA